MSATPASSADQSAPTAEETRALTQTRLALVGKAGFAISGSFLIAVVVIPMTFMGVEHTLKMAWHASYLCHAAATLVLGIAWLLTAKRRWSARALGAIDVGLLVSVSVFLALMGGFSGMPGPGGMFQASLAIASMFALRGIVLPSTGLRTLAVCAAATVASLVAISFAFTTKPGTHFGVNDATSAPAQVINMFMWLSAFTAVATIAARVIYTLRTEVREARRLGQYMLHEKLGEGGMGVVYRATHAMLRRETAIKLLPPDRVGPEALARFEREVVQTARLANPNTVAIYDYGRTPDGVFYYAMEYLEGIDLHDLVEAVGPLPPGRVVHLLQQICGSLAEAHGLGLVHRDVKPENVVLSERGGTPDVVKVLDFGLVKNLQATDDVSLTAVDSITGTPLYLAPEVIRDPHGVGPASDLYAVAAVGYFLLTGSHVFSGNSVFEVCAAHVHREPEPPSARVGQAIPEGLEKLILQGLAKRPQDRPASARAMREALLACETPPWTESDAAAWWASTGAKLLAKRGQSKEKREMASTVEVDLARRN